MVVKIRKPESLWPLLLGEISKDVWIKVATNLLVYLNKCCLIVIDYISKYFKRAQLPNVSSDTIITHMRSRFALLGLPKVVLGDDCCEYKLHEFKKFLNCGTSYVKLFVLGSHRVLDMWEKLFKSLREPY